MNARFDDQVVEWVRNAVREQRWDLIYAMTPADDGGQSYEMKCLICGALGNILAAVFVHDDDCPVMKESRSQHEA